MADEMQNEVLCLKHHDVWGAKPPQLVLDDVDHQDFRDAKIKVLCLTMLA